MKKMLDLLSAEVAKAFAEAGYDEKYARVSLSNRPDLCEYQCNGAMAAAKEYHKAPIMIANAVVEAMQGSEVFGEVQAVNPGFINMKVNNEYLSQYLNGMEKDERMGCEKAENPKTIMIDYGGPNVAKPLHVGHLRSAIIGESVKRIARFAGHKVIGDVHLGDWGLQMGLIITELRERKPELVYFDEAYERGKRLTGLDLSGLDVNMFAAIDNHLINDGCGWYRGRLILPYEHLSRFQNDLID